MYRYIDGFRLLKLSGNGHRRTKVSEMETKHTVCGKCMKNALKVKLQFIINIQTLKDFKT